ncbi:MAG: acetate--CoA ligase family protein [Burkholderiaceae bacterium]|nr:acetate--CoA ligase family protein [Burkholderiaceae bacterium]
MNAPATLTDRIERLRRLLNPRSVAVAGGEVAAEVIRQCRAVGYAGEVWAINPHRTRIEGVPSFPNVDALPAAPDAAFIGVRRDETIKLVASLARRGAGGAVCYASGFAEAGGDGIALQRSLVAAAADMALLGPNCYGAINYLDGCALWPDRQGGRRVERGVAILTQSGNIALNLSMQRHNLPIAYLLAIGNCAVSDVHDCIAALLRDARVTAIGLHLEGLNDIAAFDRVARAALAKGVGVVALKAGASELGAELTASHTSSLSGPQELYAALFDRVGVARVSDLAELLETLKLLHVCGVLAGARVGSLSCSGGDASLMADIGQTHGLQFPRLDPPVAAKLASLLGPRVPLCNPLDYQTYIWGDCDTMTACFAAMMGAGIDVCALVLDFPHAQEKVAEGWREALDAFLAAHRRARVPALVVSSMPELMPAPVAERIAAAGVAPMQGLRETAVAIAAAARIGARRSAPEAAGLPGRLLMPRASTEMLDELAAKEALRRFGVRVPAGGPARDADEAVAVAETVGYPVVVKALSAELAHKSDVGAVRLNLTGATQVREAVAALSARFANVLVEKMISGALLELIVGVTRNEQFGLALTIGAGGIWVELLSDAATLLLPATRADIERALRGLRCFALLDGYRGRPRADLPAVVDAIAAVAAFAEANADRLVELDVNPLIATPQGATAVDALVRWFV